MMSQYYTANAHIRVL